jgi:hypothetical protein
MSRSRIFYSSSTLLLGCNSLNTKVLQTSYQLPATWHDLSELFSTDEKPLIIVEDCMRAAQEGGVQSDVAICGRLAVEYDDMEGSSQGVCIFAVRFSVHGLTVCSLKNS